LIVIPDCDISNKIFEIMSYSHIPKICRAIFMVFMHSDQRKKGSHGFSVRSLGKAFRESKKSETYLVGSSSTFVGVAALAEAGAEPGVEPAGKAGAAGVSEAIATKYGIK
jgi:hypothetical protein